MANRILTDRILSTVHPTFPGNPAPAQLVLTHVHLSCWLQVALVLNMEQVR